MNVIHADSVPLHLDETGTIRVAGTRITLDVLLGYLFAGVTPEQIIAQEWYPTLSLADVYGSLAYYHRHQAELDEYLRDRREESTRKQREIETIQASFAEVQDRLLAKRTAVHAPAAER